MREIVTCAVVNPPSESLTDADANRLQQRLEELARDEAEGGKGPFDEWLADCVDSEDIAFIVSSLICGTSDTRDEAQRYAERIRDDYIAWRTNERDFIDSTWQRMVEEETTAAEEGI